MAMPYSTRDILLFVIGFFFPPIPVAIKRGCGADLLINLALCLLAAVPGIIHSWYIIHKYNDYEENIEHGGLRYHAVAVEEGRPTVVTYGSTNPQGRLSSSDALCDYARALWMNNLVLNNSGVLLSVRWLIEVLPRAKTPRA
ncbi:hypothetical protein BC936DRAFT_146739 [Jimgerdemannia flammicorona]|nr:hypothetical protein BC936DRAFT_146739 [Jimgerdemannia flammicorona]